MTTRRYLNNDDTKPGVRYNFQKNQERKERQLTKYLNECGLQKRVNPETHPKRSELIEEMFEQKKVMKNRTCRRQGAKSFNFKKQSAAKIISQNKIARKDEKSEFENKHVNKREIENILFDLSDQE